ncbi:hypothetical protein BT67DRAFT_430112 [Trichocladium antarcticum]|uniref:Uncharacterized protein n=1 Tax=Trichocladium antarcticum TaxID=1450529 RepID=A0AAN6Z8Y6_9PEZI|nr:hypothetical protein BT67DRAFT_430112 [Trichocladium antarcticum]
MALRKFALDWEWQREYCQYHLYELPTHLREALVSYLVTYANEGVSIRDLQALLLPPPDIPEYLNDPALAPSTMNDAFHHLDLSTCPGRSLKLRDLTDLLFPWQPHPPAPPNPQESWDDEDDDKAVPSPWVVPVPQALLPNLTHLSLALLPGPDIPPPVSWRHLLTLASRLPGLTHLSLAHWPHPTLTPNARRAAAAAAAAAAGAASLSPLHHPGRLDGEGLAGDGADAVSVLRRLSRSLYGLEFLDVTGCGGWFSAFWAADDVAGGGDGGDGEPGVDWVGAWGKVATVVMLPGFEIGQEAEASEAARYWEVVGWARRVERHVRAQRRGRGRGVVVETGG